VRSVDIARDTDDLHQHRLGAVVRPRLILCPIESAFRQNCFASAWLMIRDRGALAPSRSVNIRHGRWDLENLK